MESDGLIGGRNWLRSIFDHINTTILCKKKKNHSRFLIINNEHLPEKQLWFFLLLDLVHGGLGIRFVFLESSSFLPSGLTDDSFA